MARLTGLEPATPGVTGRYSNQLSYNRADHDPGRPGVRRGLRRTLRAVKRELPDSFHARFLSAKSPAGRGTPRRVSVTRPA